MDDLDSDGYALAEIVLAAHQCEHISASLPAVAGSRNAGVRNLIGHPTVVTLLTHERLGKYLWSLVGRELVAVRATLFDAAAEAKLRVQWQQGRAIAVKERLNVAGYGPWSTKSGELHVEAPEKVLAQMLAIRIHLDECGAENAPLRVVPGSHRFGKLSDEALALVVAEAEIVELYVPQGGFLLTRPLLIHAPPAAHTPEHRRVLHLEFAPREAISPLKWQEAVGLNRAA